MRRRRRDDDFGFRCPFCGTREPPQQRSKVSTAGWVMFVLLLLVLCWPLAPFALLSRERYSVCWDCGVKLG